MRLEDLIAEIKSLKIRVNENYQRSGQIWPARSKSFLVETVLLQMPIPRVLLHVLEPSLSSPHHSDIIDGQQRCTVLSEFKDDRFALTADIDDENNHGKRFSELAPNQQESFNNYLVPIDRYKGMTDGKIRHIFRRLNYYTAPLNAAEQRHAQFAGEMSRFVEKQSAEWRDTFQKLRTFTRRQHRRKGDQQLIAEVVDAMLNGVSTATAKSLRDVYKKYNRQFPSAGNFLNRLDNARAQIGGWSPRLSGLKLMRKHYQVFSLLMALMHAQGDLVSVRDELGIQKPLLSPDRVIAAIRKLDEAVTNRVTTGRYAPFWKASQEKTNVKENRLARCRAFYRALTG